MDDKEVLSKIGEHELKLNDHKNEIGSLKHRMTNVEEKQSTILELTVSVHDLSMSMKSMLEEQKKQGQRLEALEKAPLETTKHIKYAVISAVVSLLVGGVGGALLAIILK